MRLRVKDGRRRRRAIFLRHRARRGQSELDSRRALHFGWLTPSSSGAPKGVSKSLSQACRGDAPPDRRLHAHGGTSFKAARRPPQEEVGRERG
jgi:hypothetical protein